MGARLSPAAAAAAAAALAPKAPPLVTGAGEPGASWAGTVPPRHTYTFEAAGEFPEDLKPRLKGVQACIWTENFISRDYFNRLVFPRLPAIAEAAWTPRDNKDWLRFAAIVRLSPRL